MSPIGRPHDPAATPGAGQWRPPGDQAGVAEHQRPGAESSAEGAEGANGAATPPPASVDAGAAEEGASEPAPGEPTAGDPGAPEPAPEPGDDGAGALAATQAERDEYLELARAKQAELENFRKQVMKRQADHLQQAAAELVTKLLPVLDALDNGVGHGDESLAPVRAQLLGVLEKEGLRRVEPVDAPFDPNEHDAVAHEPGDDGEATVAETLRAGYRWNGRLLRPAMVRVRG